VVKEPIRLSEFLFQTPHLQSESLPGSHTGHGNIGIPIIEHVLYAYIHIGSIDVIVTAVYMVSHGVQRYTMIIICVEKKAFNCNMWQELNANVNLYM